MSSELLERARAAYARCQWDEAYADYGTVEDRADLEIDDLAAFADAAWWLGYNDESLALSEELHARLVQAEEGRAAARVAVEIGFLWLLRGELAVGSGWTARAARMLEDVPECAEHGYLLYLDVEDAKARGEYDRAVELTRRMEELGERHGDVTLATMALVHRGIVMIRRGDVDAGLGLLDQALLPVHAGQVAPNWTGNLYCQLMAVFIELADYPRARTWTDATERWCDGFSNAAMFRGICRVHRAQLLDLEGRWSAAEQRAGQACHDLADMNVEVVAEGYYQIGELRRRRGDRGGAESAYLRAHELGRDPQPGLALLRLLEGRGDRARSALHAALLAAAEPLARVPLRRAEVEVAEAQDDAELAREAARELEQLAERYRSPGLVAAAHQATGTADLLAGEIHRALPSLREASRHWRELGAIYDAARVRVLVARGLELAGDSDAAERERGSARTVFEELGAVEDLRRLEQVGAAEPPGGLTRREAEILALVAHGSSNRAIADELVISERTVERHLSNIFVKLGVGSRTEAAGFAYRSGLVSDQSS